MANLQSSNSFPATFDKPHKKMDSSEKRSEKMPACNERFGAMAAVPPQKVLCGNEHLYPVGTFVEAATAPSRQNVARKRATAQWTGRKSKN
jgi:hypothetical protein